MPKDPKYYDSAKKIQVTLLLTEDTLEIIRKAYEKFRYSYLDGEDWSKQSFDEFIDNAIFFGVNQVIDDMSKEATASE